jgi:phosphoribosylformimino-5-aminoimidazole carboxamide ribotide isomerase
MEVIPAVDVLEGAVVRLAQGDYDRVTAYAEDPAAQARVFVDQGAALVHVVDLEGARSGAGDPDLWHRLGTAAVPFEAAGGLRTVDAAAAAVAAGAERVVLGSAAVWDPATCAAAVEAVGGDRVVASIDVKDGRARGAGWLDEGRAVADVVRDVVAAGVGRLLVTAIVRDGMLSGPDLDLLGEVRRLGDRPVIAAGGIGSLDHLRALAAAGIDEAIVGRALYEGRFDLPQALEAVRSA